MATFGQAATKKITNKAMTTKKMTIKATTTRPPTSRPSTKKPLPQVNTHEEKVFMSDIVSPNHYLNTGIIAKYKDTSLMQCMNKCKQMSLCKSFSAHESRRECLLHDIQKRQARKDEYVYKKGFTYWESI